MTIKLPEPPGGSYDAQTRAALRRLSQSVCDLRERLLQTLEADDARDAHKNRKDASASFKEAEAS